MKCLPFTLLLLLLAAATPQMQADITAIESLDKRPHFKPHPDWVGVPLPFAPIEQLRLELEKQLGKKLQHRGEAHVTVITPPEWRVIGQVLKMSTLDRMVAETSANKAKISVKCLKKVSAQLAGRTEESWFIAVDAPELRDLRHRIWRRFLANGGSPDDFQWKRWAPHITLGFTARDLHDEDRVNKEKMACAFELKSF